MADAKPAYLIQSLKRFNRVVAQTVTDMDFELQTDRQLHRIDDFGQYLTAFGTGGGFGVASGVNFNDICVALMGQF